jgi:hypothetical protein
MSDTVKAVMYHIENAINLSQDELKDKLKEAIDHGKINHFEIITKGKNVKK